MARFHIFLVRADYERLAGIALFSQMCFVRLDEYPTRKIPVSVGLVSLTDLGNVDAPSSQHETQFSVYPTKPVVTVRQFTRKIGEQPATKVFTPNGADLDVGVQFQPCVIRKRCITPGHFVTTDDTSETRALVDRIKKCFEKEFVKTRYWDTPTYVGPGALALQKAGYRLCANGNFPRKDDLKLEPASRKATAKPTAVRRTVARTWRHLGEGMPRDARGKPFVPPRMPRYDDEDLGFSFFRTSADEADYSNCSIPRTYFARSEFSDVNFRNTDLSESSMCWNDFTNCDFSNADLSGCDMRASNFLRCKFVGADLRRADLRRSNFEDSTFRGANLKGAVLDRGTASDWGADKHLSRAQVTAAVWHDQPGDEPDGG